MLLLFDVASGSNRRNDRGAITAAGLTLLWLALPWALRTANTDNS